MATAALGQENGAAAGATFRHNRAWTSKLFVTPVEPRLAPLATAPLQRPSLTLNAQLSGRISKDTRVSFEAVNLFDERGMSGDHALFAPGDSRGFRVRFTRHF